MIIHDWHNEMPSRASWREIFSRKAKSSHRKEKEHKKGDISNGVRKGTFLNGFDTNRSLA
jgi:hypothetical protein